MLAIAILDVHCHSVTDISIKAGNYWNSPRGAMSFEIIESNFTLTSPICRNMGNLPAVSPSRDNTKAMLFQRSSWFPWLLPVIHSNIHSFTYSKSTYWPPRVYQALCSMLGHLVNHLVGSLSLGSLLMTQTKRWMIKVKNDTENGQVLVDWGEGDCLRWGGPLWWSSTYTDWGIGHGIPLQSFTSFSALLSSLEWLNHDRDD
jgi:hypothetical protein